MAKIHGLMDVGKRGMAISQSALQTTSHNIANKATEGYSRQRVDVVTAPPVGEGRFRIGTGSEIGAISRVNNPWLEKQIEREGTQMAFLQGQSDALQRVETVFNEQAVKGLNNSMSEFFNSFRELSNSPESPVARAMVRDKAKSMIQNFQSMDRQIDSIKSDLNQTIKSGVEEVNGIVKEIAQLNEKIQQIEVSKDTQANDERDRRDLLVKKLSERVNITYGEDPKTGMINITAGNTAILVAGTSSTPLSTTTTPNNQTQVMYELSKGGTSVDLSDQFKKGSLGGAFEFRDGMVNDLKSQMEELAYTIAHEVNKAHAEGYDSYNIQGVNFFSLPQDGSFSLNDLAINKDILEDPSRIAAAARPNAPGDNTVANLIQGLQFKRVMGDGQSTFDDFYNSRVGQIGVATQNAVHSLEVQKNVMDQLHSTRESISGVNLDEEATKMIEYQKAFEASARVIRMADEMFDTVLNLKRI
jgi:flagellar hook-associated protein 1